MTTLARILPPWDQATVDALNRYQRAGNFHPFTCGNERSDERHHVYARTNGDPDLGLLVATPEGWICPACDYTQKWAHAFMVRPA